jgi:hypothetical protein
MVLLVILLRFRVVPLLLQRKIHYVIKGHHFMKAFADNCQACGREENSTELSPIKLSSVQTNTIKVCTSCLQLHLALKNYKEAARLIVSAFDNTITDAELSSPNVVIEPAQSLVQKAVDLLKKTDPGYFVGVRKIVIAPEANYGHVESGAGKDPAVIHLNLDRIQRETRTRMTNQPQTSVDEAIVQAVAQTIAHERGHVKSYTPQTGFQGGEGPAEAEEQRISNLIGQK